MGRHVHAAKSPGERGISRQRGRSELGERGLRSVPPHHGCQHQPPHRMDELIPSDQYAPRTKRIRTTASMENSGSRRAHPTGFTAPSCSLLLSCRATSRPGVPPKPWIYLPAKQVWDIPLGTMVPGQQTGSLNLGGPMVTAGGLVFTSAAMDLYLRAFDIETGKELGSISFPQVGRRSP